MSGNELYEFRQREIQDLQTAKAHTIGVCSRLEHLQRDIIGNDPILGSWSIILILDDRNQRESCLDPVDDLLDEVAQAVTIPSLWAFPCRSDDTEISVQKVKLAHRAAWKLHSYLRNYLWQVATRGQAGYIESNDVGAACDAIVESHWQELQDGLKPLVDFDCEVLRHAVEAESKAAIARRRQNIVGDGTVIHKSDIDADGDAPNRSWDHNKAELAARFDRVLSALRAVIAAETALDPAWEDTKKGIAGAFADVLISRSQARRAFEDETPTMDALVIDLKDRRYRDPAWPTDGADDAQMLRSVWHFIHDTIGAGKPFAADDLTVMSNLYAALERAREILTESEPPTVTPSGVKFLWKPPMLEGYVIGLLKVVEDPTQREAVKWISRRSGKPAPSTSTLRKTYSWQNRPQKIPKPRTTNEAQSGVSPAQNADARVSHEEVIDTVVDIEDTLHRELVDAERDAVAWTLQQAGANEEERVEAISQLIAGFRNAGI